MFPLRSFLLGLMSQQLFSVAAFGQATDDRNFHFQMPVGVQYVSSSSWKPYQVNYGAGLSMMHRLHHGTWWFDWGLTAALAPQKDTSPQSSGGGNLSQPSATGSELVSFYTGLGQQRRYGKALVQVAAGASYLYSGFAPLDVRVPDQKRNSLGAYLRLGAQFWLSSSFLLGPYAGLQIYSVSRQDNIGRNPTNVSVGLLLGPGR